MASRYTNATLNNGLNGTRRNPVREALSPTEMLRDGTLGGVFGGLSYTGSVQYPFGKPPQTRGEYNTQKAWIEKAKKFCDEDTIGKVDKQKVSNPVDLPEDVLTSKTLSYTEYDDIVQSGQHNSFSKDVMLGKYDGGSSTNYINQAKDKGYAYFDLGEDYGMIKSKYGLTERDMFSLFNEEFLDEGINAGKTFHFSHNPKGDTGALGQEYEYLVNNGYKWNPDTMTMVPKN